MMPLGKITFPCLSLIKWLKNYLDMNTIVFLMVILDITKSLLHLKTKRKPYSHALMVHFHIGECLLVYAMHLLHSKDAWWLFFLTWLRILLKYSWMIFLCLDPHLIIVWLIWIWFCRDVRRLILYWTGKKCHFMVREEIVLGHKISSNGIEIDRAKVEIITKLPPPNSIRAIRSFLGHAGFYRRFFKDF